MFPSSTTPIRSAVRHGLDLAVEFATLGEYRVPEAQPRRPRAAVRRPMRPPVTTVELTRRARRLAPASAAARRRTMPVEAARVTAADGLRALALAGEGTLPGPRPRRRGGQAPRDAHVCVSPLER